MKVALVCPTVGQTRRGYERFMGDLFRVLGGACDATLFKGGGAPSARERVVPHVRRTGLLSRLCGRRLRYARYRLEFLSFAAALAPLLAAGDFDLVHFIDPPLGRLLAAARRLARARFRLLFTDAGPARYDASGFVDHVHCLTPSALRSALDAGVAAERLTMLPVGVDPAAFVAPLGREELRRRFDVPPGAFVVLSIASVNRAHKRVDHLIEEVARAGGDPLLWLDGSLEPDGDPGLLELGRARLGARFRYSHVASERVAELFGIANLVVSAALHEPFGMAVVEAMCAGLPVVTHDSEHFRWLLGGTGFRLDMAVPGALAALLSRLAADPGGLRGAVDPAAVARRFGWDHLAEPYLAMYRSVAAAR